MTEQQTKKMSSTEEDTTKLVVFEMLTTGTAKRTGKMLKNHQYTLSKIESSASDTDFSIPPNYYRN